MKQSLVCSAFAAIAVAAIAEVRQPAAVPRPSPQVPAPVKTSENPVSVVSTNEIVESNGLYRRVRTTFTFTNPNSRQMSWDLELSVPEGATVCAYSLEINGTMVPGVVTEKEKARVAFESEKARQVDPGVVEHVKGSVWRTRIFPLLPNVPRKASVDYIEPIAEGDAATVCEKDGDDVFVATRGASADGGNSISKTIAAFSKGAIIWDASSSAESCAAEWRKRLAALPDVGDWTLVTFRNEAETAKFTGKTALLAAIDDIAYDGGTDIAAAVECAGNVPALLFTDEIDTLGLERPEYESAANITVASRADAPRRPIFVRKLAKGEKPPAEVKEGALLATAWAANRIADLAGQAESRKDEFLALGRKYGVASPVTSLIVLETLEQYLRHKIEPPAAMSFHDEWKKRRAAEDDAIAAKKEQAEHEKDLLSLWEERVKWWNNPIPPKKTPKSGLFDGVANAVRSAFGGSVAEDGVAAEREAPAAAMASASMRCERRERSPAKGGAAANPGAAGTGGASITIMAWNPKAPYLDAIGKAADPYAEYLSQKKSNGSAPAFYMDCADWFFKNGKARIGTRVISNMAEFNLGDAAVWRSMGWRLREAGEYSAAVRCFRMALKLRGEEGQSRRDLSLVLAEMGKDELSKDAKSAKAHIEEAMRLLRDAAFKVWARRSGRRSNDRQVSIISLEELNALIAWSNAAKWPGGESPSAPEMDPAYRRDLPVKVRIVLSWSADETDIDLHVLEPDGEEAYYGHRRTGSGGFVGEDVTTGYGPEEYLRKEGRGKFKILTNYYSSHQTALTGAVTATATVYTDWGTAAEKRAVLTLRLDKPKDKHLVGEVNVE